MQAANVLTCAKAHVGIPVMRAAAVAIKVSLDAIWLGSVGYFRQSRDQRLAAVHPFLAAHDGHVHGFCHGADPGYDGRGPLRMSQVCHQLFGVRLS